MKDFMLHKKALFEQDEMLTLNHEGVYVVFSCNRCKNFSNALETLADGIGLAEEMCGCEFWSDIDDYGRYAEHIEQFEGCRFTLHGTSPVVLSYEELYYYMDLAVKWHIKNYSDKPEYVERLNNALAAYRERFLNSESPEAILARVHRPERSAEGS